MNKPEKEMVMSSGDEDLRVFVRPCLQELTQGDIEVVAGGRRAMIVPNG